MTATLFHHRMQNISTNEMVLLVALLRHELGAENFLNSRNDTINCDVQKPIEHH